MSNTITAKPGSDRKPIDPTQEYPGPPEEEFWERYNRRLEFPLSTVTAIMVHVLVASVLVFILVKLMDHGDDRSGVPVKIIGLEGGMDDSGAGSTGSGKDEDDLANPNSSPWEAAKKLLPSPEMLPQAKADLRKIILDDPKGDLPISDANAPAYADLDQALRDKLLGLNKGSGGTTGKGPDGSPGSGPGGTGSDSTRARSLRWVLRFRTINGEDYVDQLSSMGAVIFVPLPPDNKNCVYFPNLKELSNKRVVTPDEIAKLHGGQLQFSDTRPESVRNVCNVLGVREPARSFWAFFPRGLEEDLARKEQNYRNRRSEDIEETVFRVVVRGGGYEIVVDDQTAKR